MSVTPAVAAPATRRRARLPQSVAFTAVAVIFVLFMAASSVPSPLYVVYQQEWGFSSMTLTVVFAVYVLGLIASLLVVGALSDHVGRRPVLAAAIIGEAVSLVLFLVAGDVSALFAARVVQGVATGAAMSVLGATLVDLNPAHAPSRAGVISSIAPTSGLALGALGCGALVQFAPAPTHLVYVLLLAGMVVALALVAGLPETSARRPGALASLAPRLGVPARLRPDLVALLPILLSSWSLGGLYLSLGPSVAAGIFGLTNHLVGGFVVTLLCATGALTSLVLRSAPVGAVLQTGAALLAAGMGITLAGVLTDTVALAAAGTLVSGVGFGAAALASFGTLARLAAPGERGELFSVVYVIAYLAFSVPAVIAGFAATAAGLRPTAIVYGFAVGGLAVLAVIAQSVRAARR
ncbi:MFS transporter [Amycolatopsis granulosa]|uniref:MFS transporter n=1 Tax=Amycolatopsis granulosa TaxID=185684 RepID=UPI00141FE1E2|nr:MFS transporter [Amycolatopsis granulosa]NIH88386.1 MFS family permease [Amycolatopsis granulosa]